MVRSKPRAQPKKKTPVDDKVEPIEETLTVAPASLFSIGDAVHHPMFGDGKVESIKEDTLTITFDGNVTKVIRKDFVTRKNDGAPAKAPSNLAVAPSGNEGILPRIYSTRREHGSPRGGPTGFARTAVHSFGHPCSPNPLKTSGSSDGRSGNATPLRPAQAS